MKKCILIRHNKYVEQIMIGCICFFPLGIPEEHCKKLLGTHWEMKLQVNGKKVFADQKCCECPEYNSCGVFMEGTEIEIPAMPGFGGKVC